MNGGEPVITRPVMGWSLMTPTRLSSSASRPSSVMARIKIAYYVVKKGRGYWQPTPPMKAQGFDSISCGPDGPDAWKIANDWNERWQLQRRGLSPTTRP